MQHITSHTTAVQSPSHFQRYILIGKQQYQLPKFIPSNSDSVLHSCISISIHTHHIRTHTHTHTHTHNYTFNGLFSMTTQLNRHQKHKPFWILLKQEMMGNSGISWTIRKSFAPHSRQITTPLSHHSSCHLNNKSYPLTLGLHHHNYLHLWILFQLLDSRNLYK